jgi:hypothetical protein
LPGRRERVSHAADTAAVGLLTPQQIGVDIIPNPPIIKSYAVPPEPGGRPYQFSSYPDAVLR